MHLYEVLPGGTAGDIARSESETIGLGASDEATLSQLQPLTQEAAGVLLGAPASWEEVAVGREHQNRDGRAATLSPRHRQQAALDRARA